MVNQNQSMRVYDKSPKAVAGTRLLQAVGPAATSPPIYQFGEFCLDVTRAELWRGEERRDIQPLVLDLLAYLIANRGRVASKDELFLNVWGSDVSVVDTALTTAVCEARKAIDDDHVQQWAIRTLPRRGYRFIARTAEGARV
jgi:DNA-binding winged helix-turn-helix (wHTH) protein